MAKASSHLSMVVILGRLEEEGRGIVSPCSPTLRLNCELRVSLSRKERGKRLAKSTYSPFVMAVMIVFVK